jgi:hypothetical protein
LGSEPGIFELSFIHFTFELHQFITTNVIFGGDDASNFSNVNDSFRNIHHDSYTFNQILIYFAIFLNDVFIWYILVAWSGRGEIENLPLAVPFTYSSGLV